MTEKPKDTPARRKWVRSLKHGDLVATVSEQGERVLTCVIALSNHREVHGRPLDASGSLRPRPKAYRFDKPDRTAIWVVEPNDAERASRRRRDLRHIVECSMCEDALTEETLAAMVACIPPERRKT